MKRVSLINKDTSPNFIGGWSLEPKSICDELIEFFEVNSEKPTHGVTDAGVKSPHKQTTDINILPRDLRKTEYKVFHSYLEQLFSCYEDYAKIWPFLNEFTKLEMSSFNLQRYLPGDHFKTVHTERSSVGNIHRVFAWMTYLNDVEGSGATYFPHFDIKVKPQRGLTLIWPAEWTHAHAGEELKSGKKYIITGWLSFPTK